MQPKIKNNFPKKIWKYQLCYIILTTINNSPLIKYYDTPDTIDDHATDMSGPRKHEISC